MATNNNKLNDEIKLLAKIIYKHGYFLLLNEKEKEQLKDIFESEKNV